MSMLKELNTASITDALKEGGIMWDVHEESLMTQSLVDVTNRKAVCRNDTNEAIGIVGNKYTPISNSQAFSLFDELISPHQAVYRRAVALDGGSKVVLQAELGDSFTLDNKGKNDTTKLYLTMMNSFDGSGSFKLMTTPIRLFCMNQATMARKSAVQSLSIQHSKNQVDGMLSDASVIFNRSLVEFDEFRTQCEIMSEKIMTHKMVSDLINEVFPMFDDMSERQQSNIQQHRDAIVSLGHHGRGNNGQTMYDFYNGVTEHATHYMGSDNNRFKSNILGSANTLKRKALTTALALC